MDRRHHEPSRSMPVVPYSSGNELAGLVDDLEEGECDELVSRNYCRSNEFTDELAERCDALLDSLRRVRRPAVVQEECAGKVVKKTGTWLSRHKGGITMMVAGSACCIYLGYRIGKMAGLCSDAEDMCSDAIDGCKDAAGLLGTCIEQTSTMGNFITQLVQNGTEVCVRAAQECIDRCTIEH